MPIQCEYYALEGLGQLLRNVSLVQQNINPELRLSGIVMTMFDPRTKLSSQVVEEVQRFFGELVYDVIIPRTVRLSEAPGFGQPITVYDPKSQGAADVPSARGGGRAPSATRRARCPSTTTCPPWSSRPLWTPSHRSRSPRRSSRTSRSPPSTTWSRRWKPRSRSESRGRLSRWSSPRPPSPLPSRSRLHRPRRLSAPRRRPKPETAAAPFLRPADEDDVWEDPDDPGPAERAAAGPCAHEPLHPTPHPNTFLNDGWWSSTRTPNPKRPPGPLLEVPDDEPPSPQDVSVDRRDPRGGRGPRQAPMATVP